MKPRVLDYVAILVSVAAVGVFSFLAYGGALRASNVLIEAGGRQWIYSLGENRVERVHGPLGDTTVVVKDGTVFVENSPCPDKLCERAGRISRAGQWIACVPNGVIVRIGGGGGEGIDDTSF